MMVGLLWSIVDWIRMYVDSRCIIIINGVIIDNHVGRRFTQAHPFNACRIATMWARSNRSVRRLAVHCLKKKAGDRQDWRLCERQEDEWGKKE